MDKLIVSNRGALYAKYGARVAQIEEAVHQLRTADSSRGLTTGLVYLDDPAVAAATGGPAVSDARNTAANKAAIDAAYTYWAPDYLVLLGAPDVIPHQDLVNPRYDPPSRDDDEYAWADLPYASDAPFSHRIEDFRGPTRVIGRLPDVVRATDPNYLVARLHDAASARPRSRGEFLDHFGLTAKAFSNAGTENLTAIFGTDSGMVTSPPHGPGWPHLRLAAPSHVVSCHGVTRSPWFYGDDGQEGYPQALHASSLVGLTSPGAVGTAECCYGAELYDPADAAGEAGICTTFLGGGGLAYFGSTTIAYANSEVVGWAGAMTQFFWQALLAGASSGRAALQARQRFVAEGHTDPAGMKTLAQFVLLGDPSVQPVATEHVPEQFDEPLTEPPDRSEFDEPPQVRAIRFARAQRRATFVEEGRRLEASVPFSVEGTEEGRRDDVAALAEQLGGEVSYLVHPILRPVGQRDFVTEPDSRYHVLTAGTRLETGVTLIRGILALEVDTQIVSIREFVSR